MARVTRFYQVNHMPMCPGELTTYIRYMTGLVEDLDPEVLSKDDLAATIEAFGGDTSGMYTIVLPPPPPP